MHMFQQPKWFGLSLALHLAVAASLIAGASRNVERTPKTMMVVLDNFMPPEPPLKKPAEAVVRSASTPRPSEPAKPELPRQVLQSAAPPAAMAPERKLTRDVPKSSPDVPTAAAIRPRVETSNPVPASVAITAVQHSATASDERPTPERIQQRYLKEHFAYIRDLITRQLAYPPMARKMGWSGKTVVAFVIAEDGTVHDLRVVDSSGFQILDKSATETVRNVAPYPKPPVRAEIVVPINFRMMQ
jgi:periplasmic protein TonB